MVDVRPVLGFETHYQVSSEGEIVRISRASGTVIGAKRKPQLTSRGYLGVMLSVGSVVTHHKVHRVVWQAFNGTIPKGRAINHKNGVKTDNRLANLELCTNQENSKHAKEELDVFRRGEKQHNAKLTDQDVMTIRKIYAEGSTTQRELAKVYGINHSTLNDVVNRKSWTHI